MEPEPERRTALGVRMAGTIGIAVGIMSVATWWLMYTAGLAPFPPFDLGDLVIRQTPGPIATWTIETLGDRAQPAALGGGLLAFSGFWIVFGVLVGRVPAARFNSLMPLVLLPIAIGLGRWSDDGQSTARFLWLTVAFGITLGGFGALLAFWVRRLTEVQPVLVPETSSWLDGPGDFQRRELVRQIGIVTLAVGVGAPVIGRLLRAAGGTVNAATSAGLPLADVRASVVSPVPLPPTQPVDESVDDFAAPTGVRPRVTMNDDFYVVDISTRDPNLDELGWALRVHGLVERELLITWQNLLSFPSVELDGTLMCISYEYDNGLISSTRWTGVRLRDVLEQAGIVDGTVDLICRGTNGYSDSIPLVKAMEPTTLLAYGMNGTTLPQSHGFPCRLYVPGLYGEKHVKWLQEIELSSQDYRGFWQERGWTDTAIVNTTAIIDSPSGTVVRDGTETPIGGIAFAGDRGILSVQVQIDGGEWREAVVENNEPPLFWQRWRYDWRPEPGRYRISVRAIDGEGHPQTETAQPPHPNGMTGLHRVTVKIN